MALGIGIDTGGTYTDAVIYDFSNKTVLAKTKTRTTKENLQIGIGKALDALPAELIKQATLLSLSTTLATNACVENKGGRGKLVLIGTSQKNLDWLDGKSTYGVRNEDVLCVENTTSFDGKLVNHPDWDMVMQKNAKWFDNAQALAVSEIYAVHNSSACEKLAKETLINNYNMPVIMGTEVADELNFIERGATAMLNAKLLPVMNEFITAVTAALEKRKLNIKQMIVRSDGSLMAKEMVLRYPVQTILSGPAASIIGARGLDNSENSLIVDMGGTTTDISMVENNSPAMTDGIRIGGVRTQIKGVYIDTFGLGGDSRITVQDGKPHLHTRRVQPLCMAAIDYPEIKKDLQELLESKRTGRFPIYEFLYFVKEPSSREDYSMNEIQLLDKIKQGPMMLGKGDVSVFDLTSDRLEKEGLVMRAGLTPTDIMHVMGDFSKFDTEASLLVLKYLLRILPEYDTETDSIAAFCHAVYEAVCHKLYFNIVRILLMHEYPQFIGKDLDPQLIGLIQNKWDNPANNHFFDAMFKTKATLVGIGAPTHIFLPKVAKILGTACVIPENAEVANALGAVIADVLSSVKINIRPIHSEGGILGYTVHTSNENTTFDEAPQAIEFAKAKAKEQVINDARERGALGELQISVEVKSQTGAALRGTSIELGSYVIASATGRV